MKHQPTCAREILRNADDSAAYLGEPCTCAPVEDAAQDDPPPPPSVAASGWLPQVFERAQRDVASLPPWLRGSLSEAFEAGHFAWPTPDQPTRAALCASVIARIVLGLTSEDAARPETTPQVEDAAREAPAFDEDDIETLLDAIARLNIDPAYHAELAEKVAALLVHKNLKRASREAFRAGFMAHPDAEAPVFKWSFDAETCIAADREESAWQAYCAMQAVDPPPPQEQKS